MRYALAAASLLLAALSIVYYRYDATRREPAEQFIRDFTIDKRRPITAEESRYTITFDAANEVLAIAAIDDTLGTVNFNTFTDEERRWWIESVSRLSQEAAAAQQLQLAAIAARPGWPLNYLRLGELAFASIAASSGTNVNHQKWVRPMEQAIEWAPGHDRAVAFVSAAALQFAPVLTAEDRRRIPLHVRRAFQDPAFVRRSFSRVAEVLGVGPAMQLVPNEAPNLRAAFQAAMAERQIPVAAQLATRWETEELALRKRDLEKLRAEVARGDVARQKNEAHNWLSKHPPRELGSPQAEQQLLEVLSTFPHALAGEWSSDRRAEVVRFFLDGRMEGEGREVLKPTVDMLAGAPVPVTARAAIAAGSLYEAETIFTQSGGVGGFEWTPMLIELSRAYLKNGNPAKARESLSLISEAASQECDVLLARRRLATIESDVTKVRELSSQLADAPRRFGPEAWSTGGDLSICLDPAALQKRSVTVTIRAAEPLLLDYGWDSARSGTTLVNPPGITLTIPIGNREGRHTLWARERQKEDLVLSRTAVLE